VIAFTDYGIACLRQITELSEIEPNILPCSINGVGIHGLRPGLRFFRVTAL